MGLTSQLQEKTQKLAARESALKDLARNLETLKQENLGLAEDNQVLKQNEIVLKNSLCQLEEQCQALRTETGQLQDQLASSQANPRRGSALLDAVSRANERVLLLDRELTVRFANRRARELIGGENCPTLVGTSALDWFLGESPMKIQKKLNKALYENRKKELKKVLINGNGQNQGPYKIKLVPTVFEQGPGLLMVIKDND